MHKDNSYYKILEIANAEFDSKWILYCRCLDFSCDDRITIYDDICNYFTLSEIETYRISKEEFDAAFEKCVNTIKSNSGI